MKTLVAPLFTIRPVEWQAPDPDAVDCLLLTSANAARQAGDQIDAFLRHRCYAVGEASGEAARAVGFRDVRVGPGDGAAALDVAAADQASRVLHLCGRDHLPLEHPALRLERRIVYLSEAVRHLPEAAARAVRGNVTVLIHSPRAGATFRTLLDGAGLGPAGIGLAAVSQAAAAAAGRGWRSVAIAAKPRDEALLELAAKLCKTGDSDTGNGASDTGNGA